MTFKTLSVGLLAAALLAPAPTMAVRSVNPMRCDAKALRKKARYLECLARCDMDVNAFLAAAPTADGSRADNCAQRCQDRYDKALERLKKSWLCKAPEPNPPRCATKLVDNDADQMFCHARCAERPADGQGECLTACDTQHDIVRAEILASPVCKDGPTPIP